MIALQLQRGGRVVFCVRRDGREHLLEFDDPETDLLEFYREYLPSME